MPYPNLSAYLRDLEEKGDLHRVKVEVDPHLEITEITTRIAQRQGPALLFERVKGSPYPLLSNALGAERRVEMVLGRTPEAVGWELKNFCDVLIPPSTSSVWSQRKVFGRFLSMRPKRSFHPAVLAHRIEPAHLFKLPVNQSWPDDGGRFFTFPLVFTKSPVDGKQNIGVYRLHLYNESETGMHWQISRGGGTHYQQAEERGEALPLAVALGADPTLMLCGVLPLPEGIDELAFAGFLRGRRTSTVTLKNGQLRVPAEAEFILEGHVPPHERRLEGPFGDHFGHYSLPAAHPVFHVDRIWHRTNPIFPISIVGKPPQEDKVMGEAIQEMLLPLLKVLHPEIADLWAYQEAGFHNLLVIGVHQRFAKEAIKTAFWALGEGHLALSKCVVLVDPDVNARSFAAVLKAIHRHFDPKDDFILLPGTSQDTLDFTSFKMNLGSKLILDATSGRRLPHPPPAPIDLRAIKNLDSRIVEVRLMEGTLLVIKASSGGRNVLMTLLETPLIRSVPLVVAVSEDVPLDNPTLLIWGIFTRFDCERDTFFYRSRLDKGHPTYSGPLLIDATWKRGYPLPVSMDERIVRHVDTRWENYGFQPAMRDEKISEPVLR